MAVRKTILEQPPIVLAIQMSRFDEEGGKNSSPVSIPAILDMAPYIQWENMVDRLAKYKLVSAIHHLGPSPDSGHYICVAEAPDGNTYMYDDANVSQTLPLHSQHTQTSSYLLFYEIQLPNDQVPTVIPAQPVMEDDPGDWQDVDEWSEWEDGSQDQQQPSSAVQCNPSRPATNIDVGQDAAGGDTGLEVDSPPQYRRYSTRNFYTPKERHFAYLYYRDVSGTANWKTGFDEAFQAKFPGRPIPTKDTVRKIYKKVEKHFKFEDLPKPGRPRSKTSPENEEIFFAAIDENSRQDLRSLAVAGSAQSDKTRASIKISLR